VPRQDRNQSRHTRPLGAQAIERPKECTPEFLKACWGQAVARDRVKTKYDDLKGSASLSGEATAAALELLVEATGDEAFRTALLALRAYGFNRGGLTRALKERMRKLDIRPTIWLVMPMMAKWRRRVESDVKAARLTAAQYGVSGQSFEAVVTELRKSFTKWKTSVEANEPADIDTSGDTGRKLKVRWAAPVLGADNAPLRQIRGVLIETDGMACAPDDAWWRARIHDGSFHLCGVIETE
jgi:hypothetical protein